MPHSRQDITDAKNNFTAAADRVLAILAGAGQAIENAKRAANVLQIIEEEPLILTEQAKRSTIKDLAEKMGG
jgi:hypothetical protein